MLQNVGRFYQMQTNRLAKQVPRRTLRARDEPSRTVVPTADGSRVRNFRPGLLLACMADAELSGTRRLALERLLGTATDPSARARP